MEHIAPHDLRTTCAKLCHDRGGELEQIQFLLEHASVQTTEHYLGCKQNLGHPVNDLFDLRAGVVQQPKLDETAPAASASGDLERASEQSLEFCHGGSEDEHPKCESKRVLLSERTALVEIGKAIARKVFDAALKRELREIMQQAKQMASQIKEPVDVWELERYLTQRRKDIDCKYDFRLSRLTRVFGTLLCEGRVSQLRGLRDDKVKAIRSAATVLSNDVA